VLGCGNGVKTDSTHAAWIVQVVTSQGVDEILLLRAALLESRI